MAETFPEGNSEGMTGKVYRQVRKLAGWLLKIF